MSAGTLYCVVALAPLPLGSNAPVPVAVIGLALALGLSCAPGTPNPQRRLLLLGLAGLACAIGAVLFLQVRSGAPIDPVWDEAAGLLGTPLPGSRAVVRNEPLFALGNMACCLAAIALGLLVGADRTRARRLISVVAWSVLAYTVIGFINVVADPTAGLWRERDDYVGAVLGPFVNRNTAAIFFGCGAVLWATLLGEAVADAGWPRPARTIPKAVVMRTVGAGLCLSAVVASGSRSGTLLTLVALGALGLILVRRHLERLSRRVQAAAIGAPALLVAVSVLGGGAGQRFQSLGFADEGRLAVYRAVLPIIAGHPWLGTGLGTFPWIYPAYRSSVPGMRNVWDKAHSTPLELAAEVGLPLTALIAICALGALGLLLRGAFVRRRDEAIPLAAGVCFSLALVHSCIDFSLQIPGLAVVVMALVGCGLAQSFVSGERRTPRLDDAAWADPAGRRPRRDITAPEAHAACPDSSGSSSSNGANARMPTWASAPPLPASAE